MESKLQHRGVYWASFDDGETVVEVALLEVEPYHGCKDFADGGTARFLDGSLRTFTLKGTPGEIVQPSVPKATAYGEASSYQSQLRVTWLGEAKPGRSHPKPGDPVPGDLPAPVVPRAHR